MTSADWELLDMFQRESLPCFCEAVFPVLAPGQELLWNWHHDAICAKLERVARGDIKRLIIEAPPRSLKSIIVSVLFPAWLLGRDPRKKVIGASYSLALAVKLHNDCRTVMRSPRYSGLFPASALGAGKDSETEFVTAARGGRFVTSPDGTLTGRGGDFLLFDDILSAKEAYSTARREATNDWLRTTALTRLDDKRTGAIVVCCQRLHVGDLPGQLREAGGWEILSLPAIAQVDQLVDLGDDRTRLFKAGEVLHPEREPRAVLDALLRELGGNTFAAQYLQQPVPADGASIKWDWFRRYDKVPYAADKQTVQSWDIATSTSDTADWAVGITMHVIGENYYLVDVVRGRWNFPDLLMKVRVAAIQHRADVILIEEAGIGQGFIQQFNHNVGTGQIRAIGCRPEGDKRERVDLEMPRLQGGHVLLPNNAPWLDDFRRELAEFPQGRHDDQVDSLSQFLKWQRTRSQNQIRLIRMRGR